MKTVRIGPPTKFLDLRSNPEDVDGYRWVLNWSVQQKLKLCRSSGWSKLLDRVDYENYDLHDRLDSIAGLISPYPTARPWTFLFETSSASKSKILLAGHDRTVFALLLGTGNWRCLNTTPLGADGLTRWRATQNGDVVVLSNNYDAPKSWVFDGQELEDIEDLTTLGISRVGTVISWQGVTFFMNVVEQGTTKTYKIFWSDLDKPLSLIPGDESIAGFLELNSDESILAALPLGETLLVYTTRRIWQIGFSGGFGSNSAAFSAVKRYDPQSSEACLAYPNTLVSKGSEHVYAASDGIYSYTLFHDKPVLVEFINRASSYIYDTLDRTMCDWFIAKYNPARREIWYSWVNAGDELPVASLAINTEFPFSGIVDHGFTAFEIFQPNDPVTTLKQWILDQCICYSGEFLDVFGTPENEGGTCTTETYPYGDLLCDSEPDSFYTTVTQELEDGIVMEDWNEAEPSPGSLCSQLAGTTISSLCIEEARRDQCNSGRYFVMASAEDFCLKQLSDSFYRERCISTEGCGEYEIVGYKSILRSGPMAFKDTADEKLISRFLVEAVAAASAIPGQMSLRVGCSSMALDSNDETCGILWFSEGARELDCIAGAAVTHAANKTRPDVDLSWPAYCIGQWIYIELTVENANSTPPDTGASICVSSFAADIDQRMRRY